MRLNHHLPTGHRLLYAPELKFNRSIGQWAGLHFHPETGEPVEEKLYPSELLRWLPTAEDRALLVEIIGNEKDWITPKTGGRDPLETIAEPRKSAINL